VRQPRRTGALPDGCDRAKGSVGTENLQHQGEVEFHARHSQGRQQAQGAAGTPERPRATAQVTGDNPRRNGKAPSAGWCGTMRPPLHRQSAIRSMVRRGSASASSTFHAPPPAVERPFWLARKSSMSPHTKRGLTDQDRRGPAPASQARRRPPPPRPREGVRDPLRLQGAGLPQPCIQHTHAGPAGPRAATTSSSMSW